MPDDLVQGEPQNGSEPARPAGGQPIGQETVETPTPVAETIKLSKEDILRALQEDPELLSEEDTFTIPAVRSRTDRLIQQKEAESKAAIARAQEEQRRATVDYQEAVAFIQQFDGLDMEQQNRYLKDIAFQDRYKVMSRRLSNQPSADPTEVAARIWREAHGQLKQKYPNAKLDDVEDLAMAVERAAQSEIDQRVEGLKGEVEKQVKAQMASLKAQLGLNTAQPDRLGSAGAQSGGRLTWSDVQNMSPEEFTKRQPEIIATVSKARR